MNNAIKQEKREVTKEVLFQMVTSMKDDLRTLAQGKEQVFSPQQAADFAGISKPYILSLIKKNILPAAKIGERKYKILKSDLIAFLRASARENIEANWLDQIDEYINE